MKLWQKIFIFTLVLVIAAIDLTSILLLSNNHRLMVKREQQRAMDETIYFSATIKDKMIYNRLKSNKILLTNDEVVEIIKDFLKDQDVNFSSVFFYQEGEEIASKGKRMKKGAALLAEHARTTESTMEQNSVQILEHKEKTFILAVTTVLMEGSYYQIVTASDITEIFTLREDQIEDVRSFSIFCAMVIAGILLFVVWFLLLPLRRINEGTRQIAQGHYEKRLQVKGNNELAELAANMNTMAQAVEENVSELKQVAEDRNTFIANLAHEMKTPLTSILGFADILRVKRYVSNEERQEYANVIVEETRRLRTLSGKLMELITMGKTHLERSQLSAADLLYEIECVLAPLVEENEITLNVFAEKGSLYVDKELIKSLIYNLIDNAVKASKPGQEIRLLGQRQNNGAYQVSIEDDGMGIPEKEIKSVTKPFYMLNKSRSRKAGGAGLGLPLCVEIARLHGATFHIDSAIGKGTSIKIVFGMEGGISSDEESK